MVRLIPHVGTTPRLLATLWQTSLTRLSSELEGHSMGGGMLKIEPSEAENILIPRCHGKAGDIEALGGLLDDLYRAGKHDQALELADEGILRKGLGLGQDDIALLREAAVELRQRRCHRGSSG
jgi:hypothetical protein